MQGRGSALLQRHPCHCTLPVTILVSHFLSLSLFFPFSLYTLSMVSLPPLPSLFLSLSLYSFIILSPCSYLVLQPLYLRYEGTTRTGSAMGHWSANQAFVPKGPIGDSMSPAWLGTDMTFDRLKQQGHYFDQKYF